MTALIVNYWAIALATIMSVVLGFIWYGPLFGKKWMAYVGMTMPDPKPSASVMVKPIIISLIGALFASFTMAHAISYVSAYFGMTGAAAGIVAGFHMWLGFVLPVTAYRIAWEGKTWKLWLIDNGYWLVYLAIAGAIIGGWR